MRRFMAVLLALLACPAWAQFTGLATPYDGSVVYFASTLRLKSTTQPAHGKLFAAGPDGVRLFRSRAHVPLPSPAPPCSLGPLYAFAGAEVSGDGRRIAAFLSRDSAPGCTYPEFRSGTTLVSDAGESDIDGLLRLSPSGRYALVLNSRTSRPTEAWQAALFDLSTGAQTSISLPPPALTDARRLPDVGRVIADDGTAIITYSATAYLVKPAKPAELFPVANATPLAISASGGKVLYRAGPLRILDLQTGADQVVLEDASQVSNVVMSDDARRVLFLRGGQAWTVQTDGTGLIAWPTGSESVGAATLSGSGGVAYLNTSQGRLFKIDVNTGNQTEIIGRTPYLWPAAAPIDAGFTATVPGGGLLDLSSQPPPGSPPAGLSVLVGGRGAFVTQVTPTSLSFLVPWETSSGNTLVTAQVAGSNSLFEPPETSIRVLNSPRAGAIAHQDWSGLVTHGGPSPPHAGEIIHVWAVGLGPVTPEVEPGARAPSAEPLARLSDPLVCNDSTVLYAGLAPGYVERVYQVDLRLETAGYLQFRCSLGGKPPFIFLTLLVAP